MTYFPLLHNNFKRPNNSSVQLSLELINFVKLEALKGNYPSRRELENSFHLKFPENIGGIKGLYEKAGLGYKPRTLPEWY